MGKSNLNDIKQRAVSLVKDAHEIRVPVLVAYRDLRANLSYVDGTGSTEDLAIAIANSARHVADKLPPVNRPEFLEDVIALIEAIRDGRA